MASDLARVRSLVEAHGWNTTCYQLVNEGLEHWFSAEGDAVVGYVRRAGRRVVAGAPVCTLARLSTVVAEFEASDRSPVCYFGAEERLHGLLSPDPAYTTVVLGSQPVWTVASFRARIRGDRSLRHQLHRARNKGVVIEEWTPERAERNPDLQRVLAEWLSTRGLPPMHFLVESQTLAHLPGRRLFVAVRNGRPVGFVTLCPAPAKRAWLTEQFVRGFEAPNGTVELALFHAASALGESGERITMGIVPLARPGIPADYRHPGWLAPLVRWARAHGRRFYNFDGLEWFKQKFHPDLWEPVFVISREPTFSPQTLWAVMGAFSDGSPVWALARGLGRAVRTELSWAFRPSSSGSPSKR